MVMAMYHLRVEDGSPSRGGGGGGGGGTGEVLWFYETQPCRLYYGCTRSIEEPDSDRL
jgi:hypothetical protein